MVKSENGLWCACVVFLGLNFYSELDLYQTVQFSKFKRVCLGNHDGWLGNFCISATLLKLGV